MGNSPQKDRLAWSARFSIPAAAPGGSIYLTAQTVSGNGIICVRGGAGAGGSGGGGGGRISVEGDNQFGGTFCAEGGAGYIPGEPGTIFFATRISSFSIVNQQPQFFLSGKVGTRFTIETTTNLVPGQLWIPLFEHVDLTNPNQMILLPTPGEPVQFYRARIE